MPTYLSLMIACLSAVLCIETAIAEPRSNPESPPAIIDLREKLWNQGDNFSVAGQWDFVWQHLLYEPTIPEDTHWLNTTVPGAWNQNDQSMSGKGYATYQVRLLVPAHTNRYFLYLPDMASAYQWADVVVCRAGALTVSELAMAAKPAIFVPLPHAVDDHQTKNAEYLVEQGAAKVVQQTSLTESTLAELLKNEFSDRATLLTMANAARSAAKNDATLAVVNGCLEAACA